MPDGVGLSRRELLKSAALAAAASMGRVAEVASRVSPAPAAARAVTLGAASGIRAASQPPSTSAPSNAAASSPWPTAS